MEKVWLKEVLNYSESDVIVILVGNQADRAAQFREVSYERAEAFRAKN